MIDLPPSYEITQDMQPQKDLFTISYAEALACLIDIPNNDYSTYFRVLENITLDTLYELPSGNLFSITLQWIRFIRAWKEELRVIHAKNKKNASISINAIKYHVQGWELCITGKKRWMCKTEHGQILPREEIWAIFKALETNTSYTTPDFTSTGKPNKTILTITKHK